MDLLVVPDTSHFFQRSNSNHVTAEWAFLPEQMAVDIFAGKQDRAFEGIPLSLLISEMQAAPKEYHDPGSQLCKIMRDRHGRCETGKGAAGPVTLGPFLLFIFICVLFPVICDGLIYRIQ